MGHNIRLEYLIFHGFLKGVVGSSWLMAYLKMDVEGGGWWPYRYIAGVNSGANLSTRDNITNFVSYICQLFLLHPVYIIHIYIYECVLHASRAVHGLTKMYMCTSGYVI